MLGHDRNHVLGSSIDDLVLGSFISDRIEVWHNGSYVNELKVYAVK